MSVITALLALVPAIAVKLKPDREAKLEAELAEMRRERDEALHDLEDALAMIVGLRAQIAAEPRLSERPSWQQEAMANQHLYYQGIQGLAIQGLANQDLAQAICHCVPGRHELFVNRLNVIDGFSNP